MSLSVGELEATLKLRDEMSQKLRDVDKNLSGITSTVQQVGAAIGIGFSIGAVVKFGKEILDDADALVKLSDKTGISTQGLQRMRIAGDDAGNTLDELTQAVSLMQKRLTDGDTSAVGALTKLHLNLEQIKAMAPEDQFMAIGDAIKAVKDPAEQVALAMALFGRGGAAVLPTIKRGFDDVKGASVGMSDSSVRALDEIGDHLTAFWRSGKAIFGEWLGTIAQGGPLVKAVKENVALLQAMEAQAVRMAPKMKAILPPGLPKDLDDLNIQWDLDKTRMDAARTAADAHAKALEAVNQKIKDSQAQLGHLTMAQYDQIVALLKLNLSNEDVALKTGIVITAVEDAAKTFRLATESMTPTVHALQEFYQMGVITPPKVKDLTLSVEELERRGLFLSAAMVQVNQSIGILPTGIASLHTETDKFSDVLRTFPDLLVKAFTGGGNVMGAIQALGVGIFDYLVKPLSDAAKGAVAFGGSVAGAIGKASGLGTTTSSVVGLGVGLAGAAVAASTWGVGMAAAGVAGTVALGAVTLGIGAAVVGAIALYKHFKGVSDSVKESRKAVEDFDQSLWKLLTPQQAFEAAGRGWAASTIVVRDAYLATGHSINEAEAAIDMLAKSAGMGAEAAKAAIAQVNQVVLEQQQDVTDLDAAIQKYGFSIEQLGPAMQRQKLTEQAVTLMNDFRLLAGSGIDVSLVLEKMSGSINDFIHLAQKTGTEVPAAMQPMLEQMIKNHELLDANGVAYDSLDAAGLTFSETMTQGFDRVVNALNKLLVGLGLVKDKVNDIPSDKEVHIRYTETGDTTGDVTGAARGGLVTPAGVQYLASGGNVLPFVPKGIDTVPAMLAPGEGVVTRAGMQTLGTDGLRSLNHGGRGGGATVVDIRPLVKGQQDVLSELRWQRRTLPDAIRDAIHRSRTA